MKLRHTFVANAVLSFLFGIGFIAAPAMQFATFGAQSNALAELVARTYGSALLGYALITWASRNAEPSSIRIAIVQGTIIYHLLGAAMLIMAYFAGTLNAMAWLAILLSLLLAIAFAITGLGGNSGRVLTAG